MPKLSDAHMKVLAKRHLGNETLADFVGYAGLDARQIRSLFATKSMQALIVEEQARLDEIVVQRRLRLSFALQDSMDRLEARKRGKGASDLAGKNRASDIEALLPPARRSE